MLISLYDENYNGRWKEKDLPVLRHWDSQTLGWLPERTDHPLKGNLFTLEKLRKIVKIKIKIGTAVEGGRGLYGMLLFEIMSKG